MNTMDGDDVSQSAATQAPASDSPRFGLSSLGHAESHVLAKLDKVLGILHRLTGQPWSERSQEEPAGIHSSHPLLEQHTATAETAMATIACTLPEVFAQVCIGERIFFDDGRIGRMRDAEQRPAHPCRHARTRRHPHAHAVPSGQNTFAAARARRLDILAKTP